jgi:hypothetical protein
MDWEIYDGKLQHGPMPEAGVHDAIRSGLPRNAYVRQRGASEWLPLETHPLFAAALQQRSAVGAWTPPPPPPPAYVGAPQPVAPEVSRPPPTTPYAVAGPNAGQVARRKLVAGGCLVQAVGIVLLPGAFVGLFSDVPLVVQGGEGLAGLGVLLVVLGGFLNLKWVCAVCKNPIAGRSVLVCPTCHASFT